jgi:acetylornithine deacetylase/succinyl-diaminopimelate desuccinylase-like protein
MTDGADRALAYARDHRDSFLRHLEELLRVPSVSALPEHAGDMRRAAALVRDRLETMGVSAKLIEGDGHPIVYGEWLEAEGAPTVLLYGHYDVQPPDPLELWTSPPFEPDIRNGNICARGAADDKGQVLTMLNAAESYLRGQGRLPVNLKFLIEGEEEVGGRVVEGFVSSHPESLTADFTQVADSHMFAPGLPTLETGLRGNLFTEVYARGASHDLHSGLYGGVAPNPLNALAHLIAGLKDRDGRIQIPGFYDDVRMPSDEVLRSWRQLPFDEESFLRDEVGATQLTGEPAYTVLERIWARPTLDVHGIPGGFTGHGAKTVIPAEASAKISMRLVPDQDPGRILELFRARVMELASPGIRLEVKVLGSGKPVEVPSDTRWIRTAQNALRETFGRDTLLARSGGSIPIVGLFAEHLALDTVLMGWGLPDDNLHSPNEKFSLENFQKGTEATIRFWDLLAA